jgi:hypothetical protein
MNAFYERLKNFGASVQAASQRSGEPLEELFIIIHPGHPVVAHTRSTTPVIRFETGCPIQLRRKIRKLLKSAYRTKQQQPT